MTHCCPSPMKAAFIRCSCICLLTFISFRLFSLFLSLHDLAQSRLYCNFLSRGVDIQADGTNRTFIYMCVLSTNAHFYFLVADIPFAPSFLILRFWSVPTTGLFVKSVLRTWLIMSMLVHSRELPVLLFWHGLILMMLLARMPFWVSLIPVRWINCVPSSTSKIVILTMQVYLFITIYNTILFSFNDG